MSNPADIIRLEFPDLPCRIGAVPGENDLPQPVRLTLELELDLGPVMASGLLDEGVDYAPVHAGAVELVCGQTWILLESLVARLMQFALDTPRVRAASVELTKCRPPLGPGSGPVTVRVYRSGDGSGDRSGDREALG